MQKVFALLLPIILAGCWNSAPAELETIDAAETALSTAISSETFIAITANVVCIKASSADPAAQKEQILAALTKRGASERAYAAFAQQMGQDPEKQQEIALSVIGQASEICPEAIVTK